MEKRDLEPKILTAIGTLGETTPADKFRVTKNLVATASAAAIVSEQDHVAEHQPDATV